MRRRLNLNCPEIEEKMLFLWNGKILIKDNVSESEYRKFLEIKQKYFFGREYNFLHPCFPFPKTWKHQCYYIPDDMFEYLLFENGEIVEKKQVPAELKEKFDNCKHIMDIDFAFLKNYRFVGGKEIGIKPSWKIWRPVIKIVKSKDKISCSDYKTIISEKYKKNYDKNLKEQEYYLNHVYKE